jgi:c-di-GMP-binding flagellar brake protein YcgR
MIRLSIAQSGEVDDGGLANCRLVADISAGGAQILLPSPARTGETLELTMQLPALGERQCEGRVIRQGMGIVRTTSHPHWAGVMFTDLGPSLRRELAKLAFDIERERRRRSVD